MRFSKTPNLIIRNAVFRIKFGIRSTPFELFYSHHAMYLFQNDNTRILLYALVVWTHENRICRDLSKIDAYMENTGNKKNQVIFSIGHIMPNNLQKTLSLCPPKLPIAIDFIDVLKIGFDCDWRSRTGKIEPPSKDDPDRALSIIRNHCKIEYQYIEKIRKIRNGEDWKKISNSFCYDRNIFHQELAKVIDISSQSKHLFLHDVCWVCSLIRALRYYYLYNLDEYFSFDPQAMNSREIKGLSFCFQPIPELFINDDIGRWICLDFVIAHQKMKSLERKSCEIKGIPQKFTEKRNKIISSLGYSKEKRRGPPTKYHEEDVAYYYEMHKQLSANGYPFDEICTHIGCTSDFLRKILDIARKYDKKRLNMLIQKNRTLLEDDFLKVKME